MFAPRALALVLLALGGAAATPTWSISAAPASRWTVEACSSIAGLSANKRSALATEGFTRCVNAHGVLAVSKADCNCDNNLLYIANIMSEILDPNLDGVVDLATTVSARLNSFDGTDATKPLLVCGKDSAGEEITTSAGATYPSHHCS